MVLGGFAFVGVILYLTWLGYIYRSQAELSQMEPAVSVNQNENQKIALSERYTAMVAANTDKHATGKELFKTLGCTECHTTTGVASNKQGPDLLMARGNNRTHEWLHQQIIAPQSHNQKTIMPPFGQLSNENVELLVDYLESLTPAASCGTSSCSNQRLLPQRHLQVVLMRSRMVNSYLTPRVAFNAIRSRAGRAIRQVRI